MAQNYGNEPNAGMLLYPSGFTEVNDDDFMVRASIFIEYPVCPQQINRAPVGTLRRISPR